MSYNKQRRFISLEQTSKVYLGPKNHINFSHDIWSLSAVYKLARKFQWFNTDFIHTKSALMKTTSWGLLKPEATMTPCKHAAMTIQLTHLCLLQSEY